MEVGALTDSSFGFEEVKKLESLACFFPLPASSLASATADEEEFPAKFAIEDLLTKIAYTPIEQISIITHEIR